MQIKNQTPKWILPDHGWIEVGDSLKVSQSRFEQCNMVLIESGHDAILVDTGYRKEEAIRMLSYLKHHEITLKFIIITHHHEDHDANLSMFLNPNVVILDPTNIKVETTIDLNDKRVLIFPTPGHYSKGDISVSIDAEGILCCGDIMYSCLPPQLCYGAHPDVLKTTIEMIASKHYQWIVSGHGRVVEGNTLTEMCLSYIKTLREKVTEVVQNQGTEDDLQDISLSDCISHPDWMVLEPAIDLHRQNKLELYVSMNSSKASNQ